MVRDYDGTNFITGMRAWAALAVVMIHCGGAGLRDFGPFGNHLADLGRTGVYGFFVISGFSVAASFTASSGYGDYMRKRLWRILPLYYFWLAAAVVFTSEPNYWAQQFGVTLDAYNIAMHLSMFSVFDYRITNSIIGVEWSLPVEVVWYVMTPALLLLITTLNRAVVAIVGSFIAHLIIVRWAKFLPLDKPTASIAVWWSPFPYVFSYSLGVCAFRLRQWHEELQRYSDAAIALVAGAFAVYAIHPYNAFLLSSIATAGLIVLGSDRSRLSRLMFTNPMAIHLGTVSYGIYLCHLLLLDVVRKDTSQFLRFVVVAGAAAAVSTATYVLIERYFAGRPLLPAAVPKRLPVA